MKSPSFFKHKSKKEQTPSPEPTQPIPQVFTDISPDPFVRGLLHRPANPNGGGLVLSHGAGSNCQSPLLVSLAEVFAEAGYVVLRIDLPYRQDRPYGPPGPGDAKRDRAGIKNAIEALKNLANGEIFLGGHSYGGRQSSMLCAELTEKAPQNAPALAAGLLLLSYPLHPPRKPEQLRTQHFSTLRTSTLFVEGTRDPFASIAEIEKALKVIPGKTKLLTVEGVGHDLGFRSAKRGELTARVLEEFESFFAA